jgi:sialate O-acetylesterase
MHRRLPFGAALVAALACTAARADVSLNAMFGEHMVLQQGIRNRVWGQADPGEEVTVTFAGQSHATTADAAGAWQVSLDPVADYGGPHVLTVRGTNELSFRDVLIGEVWLCSGQSNMQWSVNQANDADVEKAAARFPRIRLVSVPQVGTQEPQWTFKGKWQVCTPETVGDFSAVGYFFGRQLHQTLGVPVGLIDNAWGGSAAEAWVRRDKLAAHPTLKSIHERWQAEEANYEAAKAEFERKQATWAEAATQAKAEGQPEPGGKPDPKQHPDSRMQGNARPGNIHSGVLAPTVGYGIRGVIWYQGESNASRAEEYRTLFPFLIASWREEWGLGDVPFYWAQLADFKAQQAEPRESAWAELREAQTLTMQALPNTGQAVIIDLGEGKDIHPKNKQDVATRLARWALAETYKVPGITCRSPMYQSMEKAGNKLVLSFDHVTGGWRPFDVAEPVGFTIAGEDKKFIPAQAVIRKDGRIEVWSDVLSAPVAVRYAWADNPVCNMYSAAGLPLTPFRTDDHPVATQVEGAALQPE